MLKKMLLGMFLAVVAMSATTEAAAMKFRGVMTGGSPSPQSFELSFNISDQGETANFNPNFQDNISATLVLGNTSFSSVAGASSFVSFTTAPGLSPDTLTYSLDFAGAGTLNFTYSYAGAANSSLTLNNLYEFMYLSTTAPPPGYGAGGWTSLQVAGGNGFGIGATGGSIQAVPEPASMSVLAALAMGVSGVAVRRRKLKK